MKDYVSGAGVLPPGGGVKIVAVVGSGSGCGKTTIVCRILRAVPGLGAVKISPREGPSRVEWGRGERGKDTDLYVDSGAACVARIVGPRDRVVETWSRIRIAFESCRAVIVEGSRSVELPEERLVIYVDGGNSEESRIELRKSLIIDSDIIISVLPHMNGEFFLDSNSSSHMRGFNTREEILHNQIATLADEELLIKIREFLSD